MEERQELIAAVAEAAAGLHHACAILREDSECMHCDRLLLWVGETCRAVADVILRHHRGWGTRAGSAAARLELSIAALMMASDRVQADRRRSRLSPSEP